jgi:hypothetical protein
MYYLLTIKMSHKNYSGSKTGQVKSKTAEMWKPFPNKKLKDNYLVSNKGNIKNKQTGYISKLNLKGGYYYFNTQIEKKTQSFRVHRLVAILFVKNPEKNTVVNHIDGNKLNNNYRNLEWTTIAGNNQHAADNKLTAVTKRRVGQYIGENLYEEYDSLTAASNVTKIPTPRIVDVCKGKLEEYEGYIFKYSDDNPNEKIIDPEKEGYKNIKTFPNYWINNEGQIYSKPFKKFMKLNKHRTSGLQIQLTKRDPSGKGQIKKTVLVHNLIAMYFLKKTNKNFNCVHHKDGDKTNNNIKNLEWKSVPGVHTNLNI